MTIKESEGYWKNGAFYPYIDGELVIPDAEITVDGVKMSGGFTVKTSFKATGEWYKTLKGLFGDDLK